MPLAACRSSRGAEGRTGSISSAPLQRYYAERNIYHCVDIVDTGYDGFRGAKGWHSLAKLSTGADNLGSNPAISPTIHFMQVGRHGSKGRLSTLPKHETQRLSQPLKRVPRCQARQDGGDEGSFLSGHAIDKMLCIQPLICGRRLCIIIRAKVRGPRGGVFAITSFICRPWSPRTIRIQQYNCLARTHAEGGLPLESRRSGRQRAADGGQQQDLAANLEPPQLAAESHSSQQARCLQCTSVVTAVAMVAIARAAEMAFHSLGSFSFFSRVDALITASPTTRVESIHRVTRFQQEIIALLQVQLGLWD